MNNNNNNKIANKKWLKVGMKDRTTLNERSKLNE